MCEEVKENCHELNSIKYKTMLLQGEITSDTQTILNIEELLEKETIMNKLEPWCKLDKTQKLVKLKNYSLLLKKKHELNSKEENDLYNFLINCLEKKQLNKVRDVLYDKESGFIKSIPQLQFNNITKKFLLKRCDKHVSTIKSLSVNKSKLIIKDLENCNITDKIDS